MIVLESFYRYRAADKKNRAVRGSAFTSITDCLENKANLVVVSLYKANCIPARAPFQIILRGRMNLWSDSITGISLRMQSCFNTSSHWKQGMWRAKQWGKHQNCSTQNSLTPKCNSWAGRLSYWTSNTLRKGWDPLCKVHSENKQSPLLILLPWIDPEISSQGGNPEKEVVTWTPDKVSLALCLYCLKRHQDTCAVSVSCLQKKEYKSDSTDWIGANNSCSFNSGPNISLKFLKGTPTTAWRVTSLKFSDLKDKQEQQYLAQINLLWLV